MDSQTKFNQTEIEKFSIFFVFHKIEDNPVKFDSISKKKFNKFISLINFAEKISGRKICLTLDDGHKSDIEVALPLSIRYKLPFISFIPTSNIGKKGFLDRQNIYDLYKNGFIIGSHSHNHLRIKEQSINEWREDVYKSKCILEDMLSEEIVYFSFPFGEYTSKHQEILREIGFRLIFNSRYNYFYKSNLNQIIPRIAINRFTPSFLYNDLQSYSVLSRISLSFIEYVKLFIHNTYLSKLYFYFRNQKI